MKRSNQNTAILMAMCLMTNTSPILAIDNEEVSTPYIMESLEFTDPEPFFDAFDDFAIPATLDFEDIELTADVDITAISDLEFISEEFVPEDFLTEDLLVPELAETDDFLESLLPDISIFESPEYSDYAIEML
ncbi:hypothetical protein [Candidatus Epulonipiscium viviparus]|uniref:hypothetical protein n=1 Tax=Candidatus Epulonipiscium viviparus TaxID=420336 RepID=UPI0027380BCA|nr:hypothetical protein [Candidatus Epulopiscium viviparus]